MDNEQTTDIVEVDTHAPITAQQINDIASNYKPSDVSVMNSALTSYLLDVFDMTRDEDVYQKEIKKQIIANLPTMENRELIALATSASSNKNDLISKVISPTMQLMANAQANELAAKREEAKAKETTLSKEGISNVINVAPSDVLVGMQAFMNMMREAAVAAPNISNTEGKN